MVIEARINKTCSKCGISQDSSCFSADKNGKFGLRSSCKKCDKLKNSEYRVRNKSSVSKRKKRHYEENRDKILEKNRLRLLDKGSIYNENRKNKYQSDPLYRENRQAQCRQYQSANKQQLNASRRKARAADPEKYKLQEKESYLRNREKSLLAMKAWHSNNKDRRSATNAEWRKLNREKLVEYAVKNIAKIRAKTSKRRAIRVKATPVWADLSAILELYEECEELESATGIPHHVDHVIPLVHKLVCGLHVHENLQILTKSQNLKKNNSFEII